MWGDIKIIVLSPGLLGNQRNGNFVLITISWPKKIVDFPGGGGKGDIRLIFV